MPKNVTYSMDDTTLEAIERLAASWGLKKTEVIRRSVAALDDLATVAAADAGATLAEIQHRYGTQPLAIWVSPGEDGQPVAHVRIGGEEPADVGARAVPDGSGVFVFLEITDHHAEVLIPVGRDGAMLVRPRFTAGVLPWPPQASNNQGIVIDLAAVAAPVEPNAEAVEA